MVIYLLTERIGGEFFFHPPYKEFWKAEYYCKYRTPNKLVSANACRECINYSCIETIQDGIVIDYQMFYQTI